MNIFIIPSWYKTRNNSLSGVFFKEQALLFGRHRPEWNIGISCLDRTDIALKEIFKWPVFFYQHFIFGTKKNEQVATNVKEFWKPYLFFTERLYPKKFNINKAFQRHFNNFKIFSENSQKVDFILAHSVDQGGVVAQKISEKTDIPYLIMEHTSAFPEAFLCNGRLRHDIKQSYSHSSVNIAVSKHLQNKMEKMGLLNVVTIPNMVDDQFFTLSNDFNQKKIIFFSMTVDLNRKSKGIKDLLFALRYFFDRRPEMKNQLELRLGGADNRKKEMHQLCLQLKLESVVRFLGPLTKESAKRQYQNCHCFVLPSYKETFCCVYAEALACGKPLIWTRCGGPEDFVDSSQGISIEPGNIEQLSQAIEKMIDRANFYNPSQIRNAFLDKGSASKIVDQFEALFTTVKQKSSLNCSR